MSDPLPSDLMLAGKLRIRVKPGCAVLRMAKAPERTASGTFEIPEKYRDQPLEGLVVAVGPGKPFDERYCKGLGDPWSYDACGQLAQAVAIDLAMTPATVRRYLCPDHATAAHAVGGRYLVRKLLTHRPAEVKVGDRVITSPFAKRTNVTTIFGEDLVVTDDLMAIVDPAAGMAIRASAI